jgi:hypothetical protein
VTIQGNAIVLITTDEASHFVVRDADATQLKPLQASAFLLSHEIHSRKENLRLKEPSGSTGCFKTCHTAFK